MSGASRESGPVGMPGPTEGYVMAEADALDGTLGFEVLEVGEESVRGRVPVTDRIKQVYGLENGVTRTEWGIERQDGTPCGVFDTVIPLADVWETTLARACEVQAAPQAAALAAGSTLTYGDVSFNGHRLRAPGVDVAWTDVKSVDVRQGRVIVNVARDGRLVKQSTKQVGMVGRIPNFPLFRPLFQRAFADSRPGISGSAGPGSSGSASSG